MRTSRGWPVVALALAVLGCAERRIEPVDEEAAAPDTAAAVLAAAEEDTLYDAPGEPPDSVVHPARVRMELEISAKGSLEPDKPVKLTIEGEAVEAITGGEVVLTLPTRALMDQSGKKRPELPVKKRWRLSSMAKGAKWSKSYTVPAEAAGYYRVMANAYTEGTDGGPWLSDDAVRSAWMWVSATNGQLTRWFEDSVFPSGVHPRAGPLAKGAAGPAARSPDYPNLHEDSVYFDVKYTVSQRRKFKPAVGAKLEGKWKENGITYVRIAYVPEDGLVAFGCRSGAVYGTTSVPWTSHVEGKTGLGRWVGHSGACGLVLQLEVEAQKYLPWRLLNLSAGEIKKHFKHWRKRVNWDIGHRWSYYLPPSDKIVLKWGTANEERFHWTAAHEYGHAFHHKALGGMWWKRSSLTGCLKHAKDGREKYRCALQEGFANYAGTIGSGHWEKCFEHLGTRLADEPWCRNIGHDQKPKREAWVAALFWDLTDDTKEDGDRTEYPGKYIAEVFKTCETKAEYRFWPDKWWKRTNVSNIVWCLERGVTPSEHEKWFKGIRTPADVREQAKEPDNWKFSDIRCTWWKNLTSETCK